MPTNINVQGGVLFPEGDIPPVPGAGIWVMIVSGSSSSLAKSSSSISLF